MSVGIGPRLRDVLDTLRGEMLGAEEIDACGTCERERMTGTSRPPLAMRPIYLDADDDEGETTQMMQLQDFIAQLEQEHEQHQQSTSLHEWAYEVLKEVGQPLHVKAIAARATVLAGRPVTSGQMASALSHHRRDHGDASPYRYVARGVYGLKEHT